MRVSSIPSGPMHLPGHQELVKAALASDEVVRAAFLDEVASSGAELVLVSCENTFHRWWRIDIAVCSRSNAILVGSPAATWSPESGAPTSGPIDSIVNWSATAASIATRTSFRTNSHQSCSTCAWMLPGTQAASAAGEASADRRSFVI
jgi:hypothetical protein